MINIIFKGTTAACTAYAMCPYFKFFSSVFWSHAPLFSHYNRVRYNKACSAVNAKHRKTCISQQSACSRVTQLPVVAQNAETPWINL